MTWINKIKEFFIGEEDIRTTTVEHWVAEFTTIDGKVHQDYHFPFVAPEFILSTVQSYLMIGVKYLQDSDSTFYPLENIISIKWYRDATKNVLRKDLRLAYYFD